MDPSELPWEGAGSLVALEEVRRVTPATFVPVQYPSHEGTRDEGDRPWQREPEKLPAHPFQTYIRRYTNANLLTADVWVAQGTILLDLADITATAAIVDIDKSFPIVADDWGWIRTAFDLDGTVTACRLFVGAASMAANWEAFPALFRDDGVDGNIWYQPIFHVRAPITAKSTAAGLANAPFPDRGFFPELAGSMNIHQKTHTHLLAEQRCVGGGLIWALVPGPGGEE